MTNQQILEKAIQKAIDGGWDMGHKPDLEAYKQDASYLEKWLSLQTNEQIIFNHDFAKALWGEEKVDMNLPKDEKMWGADDQMYYFGSWWQYHLQNMVIAENPIKYLGENL